MALPSKEIAPAIYSDRLVIRSCKSIVKAALVQIKQDAPSNMAEAIDFTRNFADEWEPTPDATVAHLFNTNGHHGFTYMYEGRVITMYEHAAEETVA